MRRGFDRRNRPYYEGAGCKRRFPPSPLEPDKRLCGRGPTGPRPPVLPFGTGPKESQGGPADADTHDSALGAPAVPAGGLQPPEGTSTTLFFSHRDDVFCLTLPPLDGERPSTTEGRPRLGGRLRGVWARVVLEAVELVAVWTVGAAVFFRSQWTSGFRSIMGNNGDTRLIVYLLEHWYQVFQGQAAWRDPAFYYPVKDLLGWSDAFFFYEVWYTPLRLIGFDPFLAAQVSVVLLSLVGFASFVWLARLAFDARPHLALIGGLIFTFANGLWLHSAEFQLLGVWLVPLILFLWVAAFRTLEEHRAQSLVLAAAAGLLTAISFYTGYYVAWFSTLAAGVAFALLLAAGRRAVVTGVLNGLRRGRQLVLMGAGAFTIGIVPFLVTYLPSRQVHTRSYQDALMFAARPHDLINVGTGNLVWSRIIRTLLPSVDLSAFEHTYAVTPLVMALAIAGSVITLRIAPRTRAGAWPIGRLIPAALAGTAVLLSILPIRTRFGSPWASIWRIPGANGIRAIDRIGVVACLCASLALVASASEIYKRTAGHDNQWILRTIIVLLLCVAAVEQLNSTSESYIDRPSELALLRSVQPPPVVCRAFYVVDSSPKNLPFFVYQTEAMVISQRLRVPTINGYTGYYPQDWTLVNPKDPGYRLAVTAWVREHRLQRGMCRLDLADMSWSTPASTPVNT